MISCFYTEKQIYICFYYGVTDLRIIAYSSDFTTSNEEIIYNVNNYNIKFFFKGIHLKREIAVFAYYKLYTFIDQLFLYINSMMIYL